MECIAKVTSCGNDFDSVKLAVEQSIFYHQIKNKVLPTNDIQVIYKSLQYQQLCFTVPRSAQAIKLVPLGSCTQCWCLMVLSTEWMRSMPEDRLSSLALMITKHLEILKNWSLSSLTLPVVLHYVDLANILGVICLYCLVFIIGVMCL